MDNFPEKHDPVEKHLKQKEGEKNRGGGSQEESSHGVIRSRPTAGTMTSPITTTNCCRKNLFQKMSATPPPHPRPQLLWRCESLRSKLVSNQRTWHGWRSVSTQMLMTGKRKEAAVGTNIRRLLCKTIRRRHVASQGMPLRRSRRSAAAVAWRARRLINAARALSLSVPLALSLSLSHSPSLSPINLSESAERRVNRWL